VGWVFGSSWLGVVRGGEAGRGGGGFWVHALQRGSGPHLVGWFGRGALELIRHWTSCDW
jgi:hypothetical protein